MPRTYKNPTPSANKKAAPVVEVKETKATDIKKLSTEQLNAKAAELGVDFSSCKNNGERADLIIAAMEKAKDGKGE